MTQKFGQFNFVNTVRRLVRLEPGQLPLTPLFPVKLLFFNQHWINVNGTSNPGKKMQPFPITVCPDGIGSHASPYPCLLLGLAMRDLVRPQTSDRPALWNDPPSSFPACYQQDPQTGGRTNIWQRRKLALGNAFRVTID